MQRHLADLAADSYELAEDRDAREAVFSAAVRLIGPIVTDVMTEVGRTYMDSPDPITFSIGTDEAGILTATWTLGWPAQRAARRRAVLDGPPEVPPIRISAIFPPGWTHGHLKGDHVGHWPLQVTTEADAARQVDVIWAIAEAELHEWIYTAAEPWAQLTGIDRVAALARATPGGHLAGDLRADRPVHGLLIRGTHSESTLEVVAAAGLDFVVIDREHAVPTSDVELVSACEIAHLRDIAALVRIPAPIPHLASQVLDQGAAGVVIPQCRSKEEVAAVLDGCFLPPLGTRGFSPRTRAASRARAALGPSTQADLVALINQSTTVVVQVETPELLADLDALASADRISAFLLGAHDLAIASGTPDGDVVVQATDRLVSTTANRAVAWGLVVKPQDADKAVATGARFLIVGSEAALIGEAIEGTLDEESPYG